MIGRRWVKKREKQTKKRGISRGFLQDGVDIIGENKPYYGGFSEENGEGFLKKHGGRRSFNICT